MKYRILVFIHFSALVLFFALFKLLALRFALCLGCGWCRDYRGRRCCLHLRVVGSIEVVILVHIHCEAISDQEIWLWEGIRKGRWEPKAWARSSKSV